MSEQNRAAREETPSEADQTLLGVAPPRIDSSVESLKAPVLVRSGTSIADSELPLPVVPPSHAVASALPPAPPAPTPKPGVRAKLDHALNVVPPRPAIWMLATPLLLSATLITLVHAVTGRPKREHLSALPSATATSVEAAPSVPQPVAAPENIVAELERKPADSLSSREVLLLADGRAEQQRVAAHALRLQVEANPAAVEEKAAQGELLRLAADARTSRDALAALAAAKPPLNADLLYEVWTGTPVRTDSTDLARALVYSPDVRAQASPALAVALALRSAERCEQYQAALPQALKDGDRRSLHLLTKLNAKRGCGPKKADDCFACLRPQQEELTATINAVKSRRPPVYSAQ